jgi:curved DNA-binding protein CbpA
MASLADYYAILGVDAKADVDAIRLAYRALAQRNHPDHPGGSTHSMIVLNRAWAVLRDPASRAAYDRQWQAKVHSPDRPAAEGSRAAGFRPGPLARRRTASEPATKILDFGRYAGSALSDIARFDPDYLEWLAAAPVGRSLVADINRLLHRGGTENGLRSQTPSRRVRAST